ncbi:MAG: 4Fe-4S binding protein [Anaerovoracaceae bacterium]
MLNKAELYFFSPTGGTKKAGEAFVKAAAKDAVLKNLGSKFGAAKSEDCDLTVIASPVFGGRIPKLVSERIRGIGAEGKKVVTMVVYGTRAYEDALLELNNTAEECGMEVIASAALVAQHSIVPEVGKGRPDAEDLDEIRSFAEKVIMKFENNEFGKINVPGNVPYKPEMPVTETPIFTEKCCGCGLCVNACPLEAIERKDKIAKTNPEKCNMCMACVKVCQRNARVLPPQTQERLDKMLGVLKDVRRENEFFI